ncbi:MAG: DUF3817 domain-containing protein [Tetrasphaera sp.]|nr:DUF3817 domain-containing protein [Tetrasphaera sp.]
MGRVSQLTPRPSIDPGKTASALSFFKISAIIAGLAMFVLIAEMVLKYGFDNPVLTWWSPVHGVIFMGLVAATFNLGFKVGWELPKMIGIVLASCIPFVAFIIERRTAAEVEPLITAARQ